jgi:hypothetical protein
MSNIPDPNSLGGANQAALKNICRNAFDVTQDDDVAPFDMDWHRTFSHWASVKTNPAGSLILIFSDTPQALGSKLGFKQIFQFGVLETVQPGVYLVGRSPNTNAWKIPNSGPDHQHNCDLISTAGLSAISAVVIGLNNDHIVFLPNGINGGNWLLELVKSSLDDSTITAYLKNFTEENLNCPENRGALWLDASKWIPVELAEKVIQKMLVVGLRTAFLKHTVLAETPLTNGRADLWIKSRDGADPENVVLELKVVRSKNSSGNDVVDSTMIAHLDEGVTQASEYRNKIGGSAAYLCVYDMRKAKGGTVIDVTIPKCTKADVSLKVFDVDNSSKSTRKTASSVPS